MKTFFPKLFFFTVLALFTVHVTTAACTASFTKSISGLTVTFTNTSTTTSGWPSMMMYSWNFGDATYSTLKNPVKTYSTPGIKTVTLFINDSFGCTKTVVDTFLLVSSAPTCNASFTKTLSGLTATFTNTSTTSGTVPSSVYYYWYFSDGTTSSLKNPVKTFATAGIKTAYLSVYDSSTSCSSSRTDSFLVSGPGTCAANFTRTISGLTATFTNTSLNTNGLSAGLSYYWNFGDATSSTLQNPVKTYSIGGTKTVTLTISDSAQGCFATKSETFTVSSTTATCYAAYTKTMSGLTVTFNNTSYTSGTFPAAVFYSWAFSDGTSSTLKNPVKTFVTGGTKTAQLTIYDSTVACYAVFTDTFVVTAPTATCSASFTKTISGLTVTFNNTSVTGGTFPPGVTYSWIFSDGGSTTVKHPVKTFATSGIKTAKLTVTDPTVPCTAVYIDTFVVTAPPAPCSANFTRTINVRTVTFANTSLNSIGTDAGLTYYWAFSDGTSSTLKNPTKTFATGGFKTVELNITDSAHSCVSKKIDSFSLVSTTTACSANFTRTVSGLTVTFTNTSTNSIGTDAGLTYYWSFSDGTSSTLKNPVKTFATAGYKTIELNIIDSAHSCVSKRNDSLVLTSTSSCAANFTRTVSGLTVTFNNTSLNTSGLSAGLSYYWYFSDGTSSTLKNPVKTFATAGTKTAQLTISDSSQGCFSTKTETIVLTSSCHASFTRTVSGLTVTLNNTSLNTNGLSAGLTYSWNFGDGTTSTLKNPVKTYAAAGTKIIQLTISDSAQGCFTTATETVVIPPPAALCSASFAVVIDTTTPFHFYLVNTSIIRSTSTFYWNFGDGGTSTLMTPTHTYASFGSYHVCLTVADSICTSSYCDTVGMDSTGRLLKTGAFGFTTVDSTTVSTTSGINDAKEMSLDIISLYPNPAANTVNVHYKTQGAATVTMRISDITGRVLQNHTVESKNMENVEPINISELKPAIYFLQISTPSGQKVLKFTKL